MAYSKSPIVTTKRLWLFFGILLVAGLITLTMKIGASTPSRILLWKTLNPQQGRVSKAMLAITFSADGTRLASGANDGWLRIWRISDGNLLQDQKVEVQGISTLAVIPDNSTLVYGTTGWNPQKLQSEDANLVIVGFDGSQVKSQWKVSGGVAQITAIKALLLVATSDYSVQVRNLKSGQVIKSLNYVGNRFAPPSNANSIVTGMGAEVRTVNLSNSTGAPLFRLPAAKPGPGPAHSMGKPPEVVSIMALPGKDTLIIAGRCAGNTVRLFSLKRKSEIGSLPIDEEIQAGCLSPDGKTLATSSSSGIRLWNTTTWKQKAILDLPPNQSIFAIAFSPDNKILATAGIGSSVSLWKIAS